MASSVRIACGSAYAEDRIDLAAEMIDHGDVRYLCMDGLAERTLALAHQRHSAANGHGGYDVRLPQVGEDLIPRAIQRRVTIVANMGAASPRAAGEFLLDQAHRHGARDYRVAVIEGDDVKDLVFKTDPVLQETGKPLSELGRRVIAANAYIGTEPIVEALRGGADLVIGGRIADPSLFVAPIVHELGWDLSNWDLVAKATSVGHLLECGNYVTGGNFADPPYRVVDRFQHPSFPRAEVRADGTAIVSKLPDTDGLLSVETCKMQLGYEMLDPGNYITPDVVADFRNVTLTAAEGGVQVAGAVGKPRPDMLKVLVAVDEGFIGDGQVSFAGPGALTRAELGRQIVQGWVQPIVAEGKVAEWKVDLLGVNSMHGGASQPGPEPYEVHVRLAARCEDAITAERMADAGWYLQIFGPAGVGGHRKQVRPVVAMYSCLVPRQLVPTSVTMLGDVKVA